MNLTVAQLINSEKDSLQGGLDELLETIVAEFGQEKVSDIFATGKAIGDFLV